MHVPTGVRPQDSYLRPAVCHWATGRAPPLSSSRTSSNACTFTQTKAHTHVNTHSQRQPTIFGACGAVFGFDHLFESPDRCRFSSLSLSCFSPLCPLLILGMREASSKCAFIVDCGVIWEDAHTHTHTHRDITTSFSLWTPKAYFTPVEWTEAVTVVFCFMLMLNVRLHNLTNQWRLLTKPARLLNYSCWNTRRCTLQTRLAFIVLLSQRKPNPVLSWIWYTHASKPYCVSCCNRTLIVCSKRRPAHNVLFNPLHLGYCITF